jgi:hypothetical protein
MLRAHTLNFVIDKLKLSRERERKREKERKKEREMRCPELLFSFLKGMMGALAPFSYLVT